MKPTCFATVGGQGSERDFMIASTRVLNLVRRYDVEEDGLFATKNQSRPKLGQEICKREPE